MAQNFVDYVKELWNAAFKSKENTAGYEEERKKLEEFLAQSEVLPEKTVLPDAPEYEKMTVQDLSDEEIKSAAQGKLQDYYNSSKNAIDSEIEALSKKYEQDKTSAVKNYSEKNESVGKLYADAKENTSNDSLKRGLARSSIAINKQAQLDESEAKAKDEIFKDYSDKIESLSNEISLLSVKREKALNDFNIAYAAKLTTSINELKNEMEEKKAEALKYNNTLKEKEYSQSVSKTEKESDLYSEALTQKEKENALKNSGSKDYEGIYNKMRSILSGLGSDKAKEAFLNDPIFKVNLNDYYYYKLYDEFAR